MLEICALASGSNGNCYYIGNHSLAILIDAGISTKQILLRMQQRGLTASKVKALFITHEHSDHSRAARVLCNRLGIPVYMTKGTYLSLRSKDRPVNICLINKLDTIQFNELKVHAFPKQHDATEPCSFRLEYKGTNVGVLTDIGEPCDHVQQNIRMCKAVFLESNYDEEMLRDGYYPFYLKRRISSKFGHLSNRQAALLITEFAGAELECIFLSHLSKENNRPQKALDAFVSLSKKYNVQVTSREEAGAVINLR